MNKIPKRTLNEERLKAIEEILRKFHLEANYDFRKMAVNIDWLYNE
jgi:hypothetical protein